MLMKRLIAIFFLMLPVALFASSKDRETALLKKYGLSDSQITQVFDIQDQMRATIRQDAVQLRLLHAQMEKALLPANPDMQEVNGFIDQIAQTRSELMKALVGARVQLRQIIGEQNFPAFSRFLRHRTKFGYRHGFLGMYRPGFPFHLELRD